MILKEINSKILFIAVIMLFLPIVSHAQQATEIDSKSLNLPRYSNLIAISAAIIAPQQGMMVFNTETSTNWYFNGSTWVNLAMATSTPEGASGFGSWGCFNSALKNYQPIGNFDGKIDDHFGKSVSISGDYAIVGANGDDEELFIDNGSATVFKKNSITSIWESQGKLTNPLSADYDQFGISVAITNDYAIVGAYKDDEGAYNNSGSATIFKRNYGSGIWESQGKLTNPNLDHNDDFGYSVSISGDYAIVGAYNDDEEGFSNNGSATVFKRNINSGIWESQGKLLNPNVADNDVFGYSVAIFGDYAIVGTPSDDENGLSENGSATIFKRNNSTGNWESQGKLTNPDAASYDYFGKSVAISADYAIVGTPDDYENGFNGNGSATIFKRNLITGIWESQGKFTNPGAGSFDNFGSSVSLSGDYAIVSAKNDSEGGLTGNGSATIYRRYGNVWLMINKTTNPASKNNNGFGSSVSIEGSNGRFLIGEYKESNYKGIAVFGEVK